MSDVSQAESEDDGNHRTHFHLMEAVLERVLLLKIL